MSSAGTIRPADAPFDTLADARDWYAAWLAKVALPVWAKAGFDPELDLFQENLTSTGGPLSPQRRARVQARQVWVYCKAAVLGVGEPRLDLACAAYASFVDRYRRPDGLYRMSIDDQGSPLDDTAYLYEQAFALLVMAAMREADGENPLPLAQAGALRQAIEAFRHPGPGFREAGQHSYQANAHMHLLEAALAWEELGETSWGALSDEIVALARARFIDPAGGFLREFYDSAWLPSPGDEGRMIEPGHQFEWAWLLDRWARRRSDAWAAEASRGLFAAGLAGVDRRRMVAVNGLWADLGARDANARLWPQTEYLKAALALGFDHEALVAAKGLWAYLDAPIAGAWRDTERPDGSFVDEPAPASSLYHIAGACFRLLEA